jgi:beta-phosphoglucomutase
MDNRHSLEYWFGPELDEAFVRRVSDRKESLFRQAVRGQVHLLPGAAAWLERLQAAGIRQALASSAPPENIDALVDELGIRRKFDALVSALGMPGKPNPDVFLAAARQLDTPPECCLVIEDAVVGIQAAHAAGMRCLAVANTHPLQALGQAEWVTGSLADLPPDFFTR